MISSLLILLPGKDSLRTRIGAEIISVRVAQRFQGACRHSAATTAQTMQKDDPVLSGETLADRSGKLAQRDINGAWKVPRSIFIGSPDIDDDGSVAAVSLGGIRGDQRHLAENEKSGEYRQNKSGVLQFMG